VSKLIERMAKAIDVVISGFDRIVFKGFLRPLMFPDGAMSFLARNNVLNKDYKDWVQGQSQALVESVDKMVREKTDRGIVPIPSSHTRKEDLARRQQEALGIKEGVIGAWSCVEAGQSYRACFDREKGFPQLRWESVRCKHLYVYMDHADYGFLNLRIQTWFPFQIQICMNGREWLRRQLDRSHVPYQRSRNKFFDIDNQKVAQRCLDRQVETQWPWLLDRLIPGIFPTRRQTLGPDLSYYWTLWQSEWATDLIFHEVPTAETTTQILLKHALNTGTSDRVMQYLGRPLTKHGQPFLSCSSEVKTRASSFHEGLCVRHWADRNSVKVYNEQNVVRIETTINDPGDFRVVRAKQGAARREPKKRRPMRKGVVDISLRASVSQDVNKRVMDHLATFTDATPLEELVAHCTKSFTKDGRRTRALEPIGKDRELLMAIADPRIALNGASNAELRDVLGKKAWAKGLAEKQLSARITRHLKLLRDHGLIRKMPNQHRYQLTDAGRQMTAALAAALKASTKELMKIAA